MDLSMLAPKTKSISNRDFASSFVRSRVYIPCIAVPHVLIELLEPAGRDSRLSHLHPQGKRISTSARKNLGPTIQRYQERTDKKGRRRVICSGFIKQGALAPKPMPPTNNPARRAHLQPPAPQPPRRRRRPSDRRIGWPRGPYYSLA